MVKIFAYGINRSFLLENNYDFFKINWLPDIKSYNGVSFFLKKYFNILFPNLFWSFTLLVHD